VRKRDNDAATRAKHFLCPLKAIKTLERVTAYIIQNSDGFYSLRASTARTPEAHAAEKTKRVAQHMAPQSANVCVSAMQRALPVAFFGPVYEGSQRIWLFLTRQIGMSSKDDTEQNF
jgi:hypothetical protein